MDIVDRGDRWNRIVDTVVVVRPVRWDHVVRDRDVVEFGARRFLFHNGFINAWSICTGVYGSEYSIHRVLCTSCDSDEFLR